MYASFIGKKSEQDFKYTFNFAILLKSDPAASSIVAMFFNVCSYFHKSVLNFILE